MDLRQPVGGAYIASLEPADIASLKRTYDIVKAAGGATKDPAESAFDTGPCIRARLPSALLQSLERDARKAPIRYFCNCHISRNPENLFGNANLFHHRVI